MSSDPAEGTSDGRVGQTHRLNQNSNHMEVTVKEEVEIKLEPNDNAELVEFGALSRTPSTIGPVNQMDMEMEIKGEVNTEFNSDCAKEKIKKEEEEGKAPNESCEGGNERANGANAGGKGDGHQNNPSNNSNNDRAIQRSNGNVKVRGRNRILAKKRNMATASKTRKVQAKSMRIHKCSQCDYATSLKTHLTTHIRIHTGERPFDCDICSKSFTQKQNLNTHKKTHRSLFKFHCSKCLIGFENENEKVNHETKCKCRRFGCHLCKFSTLHLHSLKVHMQIYHIGDKPFECSVCSKSFTTNRELDRHSRVHRKQLPFPCTKCGQRFVDESGKHSHEKRCKGRRYECHICRFNSFQKCDLKRHIQSNHTKKFI